MIKTLFAAAAALVLGSAAADAATWKFSYAFGFGSSDVATGSFDGDLQGDGNTIFITSPAANLALNGTPYGSPIDQIYTVGGAATAFMTLDGTDADFAFAPTPSIASFFVDLGSNAGYSDTSILFGASDSGNGTLTVTPIAAMPLPAGMAMLLAALGGFAAIRRRNSDPA